MVPTPPPTYTLPLPAALPISLTSNQRCERRHRLRLDAGARFDRLPDSKWLGLAFRLYGVGVLVVDHGLRRPIRRLADRSEEHTSELQSPDQLVCRLLLEKKKP